MLNRVQRVAAGLLTRNLSADRPIVILSGNGIERTTLALAAMWVVCRIARCRLRIRKRRRICKSCATCWAC